ncbi:inositol phosphorylceramide synthase [Streptomyces sp. TRM68367]|uniref:inositol phosphorylceramide synthase n=1 Tax=Streptomyces sp. TRM68367 TaxID=2758415 RepID=UPI0021CE51D0|nr:inositol phosphorylceramide synthase [Streptomyces sp. TRM68367]
MNARTVPAEAEPDAVARLPLVRELLLVAALFLVHKLGREPATGHTGEAFPNAHRVWDLERALRLPGEGAVQSPLLHGDTLIHIANTYYATVHFPAALVPHPPFPLAPPRMPAAAGLVDTGQAVTASPRTGSTAGRSAAGLDSIVAAALFGTALAAIRLPLWMPGARGTLVVAQRPGGKRVPDDEQVLVGAGR